MERDCKWMSGTDDEETYVPIFVYAHRHYIACIIAPNIRSSVSRFNGVILSRSSVSQLVAFTLPSDTLTGKQDITEKANQ